MRRLLHKGREWYDPVVLKAFVHVLGVFPVGTVVRLSDGSVAIVIRNNADDLFLPEVLIIRDAEGEPCHRLLKLQGGGSQTDAADLCIDEILDPDDEHITIGDYIGQVPNNEEQETAGSPQ